MSHRVLGSGVALTLVFAAMLLSAVGAAAKVSYPLLSTFTVPGVNGTGSVAVDSSGNVYVLTFEDDQIMRFDSAGNPVNFSALGNPPGSSNVIDGRSNGYADPDQVPLGSLSFNFGSAASEIAVDTRTSGPGAGYIYVTRNGGFGSPSDTHIYIFDQTGTYKGEIDSSVATPVQTPLRVCGVAVNASGAIYVSYSAGGALEGGHVDKYTPTDGDPAHNAYVGMIENLLGTVQTNPCPVAADSSGAAYVSAPDGPLRKFASDQFVPTGHNPQPSEPNPFAVSTAAVFVDQVNDHVFVDQRGEVREYNAAGVEQPTSGFGYEALIDSRGVAVDHASGRIFASDYSTEKVAIFGPATTLPDITIGEPSVVERQAVTVEAAVDPAGGPNVTNCQVEFGTNVSYSDGTVPCQPEASGGTPYTGSTAISASLTGLTSQTQYHYRVRATSANGTSYSRDQTITTADAVKDLETEAASALNYTSATLNGSFDPDGLTTHYYFEYGFSTSYGTKIPAGPGGEIPGAPSGATPVEGAITELLAGKIYHYRLVATNSTGTTQGDDVTFIPAIPPDILNVVTGGIHSDSALIHVGVVPNGDATMVHIEYGPEDCEVSACAEGPEASFGSGLGTETRDLEIKGLSPGTEYHYRVVATNPRGTTMSSPDMTFKTYTFLPTTDACKNAQVRQQTGAALLLECRAYELASAEYAGGYDVESDLIAGQKPFGGYPAARGRVLYGVHSGAIPGVPGNPTNRGLDPYVAERGPSGWTTRYVGIPSNNPNATKPFGSPLLEADPSLDTFVFGGPGICEPCYPDGSSNLSLRKADGTLVKGMAGSLNPAADPAGEVRKVLSSDGSHLIFGSEEKFEEAGNEGSVSIYDRNLLTDVTQVVSTTPSGAPMTGQVAGLDVSADGSRVLVGKVVGEDVDGNELLDLYMHEGNSPNSITVADTPNGVQFNGMTADGTTVFFSTADALAGDSDTSVDLYRANVGTSDPAPTTRVSTGSGGTGDTNACTPTDDWNSNEGAGQCNTVAFAGGAGVASEGGAVYFASPEQLDGTENSSEAGEANLYLAKPGDAPRFVSLLDSAALKPPPGPAKHQTASANFIGGLTSPGQIAVDQTTGEIYVTERGGSNRVSRFDSEGNPSAFSSLGSNKITGQSLGGEYEGQVAVDRAPGSPLNGAFYVTTNGANVRVYEHDGSLLGQIVSEGEVCGVSVDQETGDVYLGMYSSRVFRYTPISKSPLEYGPREEITANDSQCNIDAGGPDYVYTWQYEGSGGFRTPAVIYRYPKSAFAVGGSTLAGVPVGNGRYAQTDPSNGDLYIMEDLPEADFQSETLKELAHYDSNLVPLERFGFPNLVNPIGFAINGSDGTAYAAVGSSIQRYKFVAPPYKAVDSIAVDHGLHQAAVHSFEDFQVSPDGEYAAFSSPASLTGYPNEGRSEVYRYDADADELDCVSCPESNASPENDTKLTANGANLTDDGRVFFTTPEPLVLRDGNARSDVYEWVDGQIGLVSTGLSADNSTLLGVGSDGVDAFFFTREALVPQDQNASHVRIYDARAGGGYLYIPAPALCKASDECHGAGSPSPRPLDINSGSGVTPSSSRSSCPKGKVRRHGKCVRRHKHRREQRGHRRIHTKRGGSM